jgi:hypothetical protein
MSGCLLRIIPRFISNIANPNGKLLPGIDTGNRNGATRTRQDSKPPCSPMSSKKSLKFIPSAGISLDIHIKLLLKMIKNRYLLIYWSNKLIKFLSSNKILIILIY